MIRAYIYRVNIDRVLKLRRGMSEESCASEELYNYTVAMFEINLLIVGEKSKAIYLK